MMTSNDASTTARPTAKASLRPATDHTRRYSWKRASPAPIAMATRRKETIGYQLGAKVALGCPYPDESTALMISQNSTTSKRKIGPYRTTALAKRAKRRVTKLAIRKVISG